MRKFLVCVLIGALLSGCVVFSGIAEESPVTLTIMNWQFNEAGKSDQIREILNTYAETHNVQFEEISVPWGQYEDTIMTKWASGDGPDIIHLPDAIAPLAIQQGYLYPLSDSIDFSKYESEFTSVMDSAKVDGKYYAFVNETVPQKLIYLPDLMTAAGLDPASPPKTVDEFIEYALAIRETNPDWLGYGCRNSMDQSFGWWSDYCSWSYGFGARWAIDGVPTINSPENVAALTAYKKMYDSGAMTQGVTSANYRKAMSLGQCGFLTDNYSNIHNFKLENPDLNITASALPFPCEDTAVELTFYMVSKDAKHLDEALEFIEWYMQPEVYSKNMESFNVPCGAYKNTVSEEWIQNNQVFTPFIEGARHGVSVIPEGLGVYMGEVRDAVLRAMETVLLQNVSPEEALNTAQEEVELLLQ